jgi:dephospho-CoA kinase
MMHMDDGMLNRCYALTGSIATGKSTVARMMSELGAHIIDTDQIARQVVEPGQPALLRVAEEFGRSVLNGDGTLNREAVRNAIIRDTAKRNRLNEITHPAINAIVVSEIGIYNDMQDDMPIIIDVPLLFEAGWHKIFRTVILVYIPRNIQIERLMKRDGLDRETAELTLNTQMSVDKKRELSRYVIDNSGSIENTQSQVRALFNSVLSSHN